MRKYDTNRSDKEYAEIVDAIDSFAHNLNDWEVNFISDLIDNPPEHYSENRRQVIERIYDEKM